MKNFCVRVNSQYDFDEHVASWIEDKGYLIDDSVMEDATGVRWLYFDGEKVRACEGMVIISSDGYRGGPFAGRYKEIHPADIFYLPIFERVD